MGIVQHASAGFASSADDGADVTTSEVDMVRSRLGAELEWLTAHRGTLEAEAQMYTLELEAFLRKFGVDYMPHAALAMSIVARELELENLEAPTTPKVAE